MTDRFAGPDGPSENVLAGRNPVYEALRAGSEIEKLFIAKGGASGPLGRILAEAAARRVPVIEVDRARLDRLAPNHQGVAAFVSAVKTFSLDDLFLAASQKAEPPFFIALDGITDPHNLGAIARSAECAGAHGLILPKRRAAGLTPAAYKAAAGAFEYIKVAKVVNLSLALDELRRRGVWVFGAAMDGAPYTRADLSGPIALVIGSEGEGISRLVLSKCDHVISIPLKGRIGSLNASCAAAVLACEIARARSGA